MDMVDKLSNFEKGLALSLHVDDMMYDRFGTEEELFYGYLGLINSLLMHIGEDMDIQDRFDILYNTTRPLLEEM